MLNIFVSQGASVINYSSMEGIEVSLATEQNQAISTLTIKVWTLLSLFLKNVSFQFCTFRGILWVTFVVKCYIQEFCQCKKS